MSIGQRLAAGLSSCALLGAVAGTAVAPVANAAPDVPAGVYDIAYPDLGMQATWVLTPCGVDCVTADSAREGSFVNDWTFRLAGDRWTFSGPGELQCQDGVTAPAAFDYGFDAATLAGVGQATFTTDGCAGAEGTTRTFPFSMTKAG